MQIWILWVTLLFFPSIGVIILFDWALFKKQLNLPWWSFIVPTFVEVCCYIVGFVMGFLSYKLLVMP